MSRTLQNHSFPNATSRSLNANAVNASCPTLGRHRAASRVTALNIEFVAKPHEAHRVHAALPAAITSAFGEVAGYAGSFVMIANHEARLVTVVTLWTGEDRMQRCNENVRRVRALLAPYVDRCLRVQTLATYVPCATQVPQEFEPSQPELALDIAQDQEDEILVA